MIASKSMLFSGFGRKGNRPPGRCKRKARPRALPPLRWRARCPKSAGMSIRPIVLHPDPRLKKVAAPVPSVTPEHVALARDMLETMYDAPGIGLAAPQIGVSLRVIVMDCIKDPEAAPRPMILFNPEITWESEDRSTYEEGCLSIPEHYAEVERPAEVRVRWLDETGAAQDEHFTGLWATCVQHEIDHLDGRLFIDYLGPLKRQLITRKMTKLKREMARA
jgi:peptide deformylase